MRTLVLNQTNLVPDGQNNKLVYSFPNSVKFSKAFLAVSSISMYYSWFNITSALNNNKFTYTWKTGAAVPATFTIIVPDGLYEIATLNQLLQFTFLTNKHYLISPTGQIVYFAEFLVNPSRYAIQINTFLFPDSGTLGTGIWTGYTQPAGAPAMPNTSFNPSIVLPVNINALLGYVANFTTAQNLSNGSPAPVNDPFSSKDSLGTFSYLSTLSPNVQPNSSILISSSGVNNPYASPTSIIYSLTPSVAVGEIVSEKPPEFMWNELIDGTYNEIRLTILGTNLSPIKVNDPSITIVLVIAQEDEVKSFAK